MTENLRTLLRESAERHPQFDLSGDPWTKGRRSRRRRQVGAATGVMAGAALLAGVVVQGTPDMSTSPPASNTDSPTLTDQLYGVTSNVPDLSEAPIGGPASVLYSGYRTGAFFDASRHTFLVSGAERDVVRVVPDAGMPASAALSPDGTKVAIGPDSSFSTSTEQNSVVVVDVVTGETTSFPIEDEGLGSGAEYLVWFPDNRRIGVQAFITLEIGGGASEGDHATSATGEIVSRVLDTDDGLWETRRYPVPESFSADGALEVRPIEDGEGRLEVAEIDGRVRTELDLDQTTWGNAQFAPDNSLVAVTTAEVPNGMFTSSMPFMLRLFDAATGVEQAAIPLGEYSRVEPIGWGEEGILLSLGDATGTWIERAAVDDGDIARVGISRSTEKARADSVSIAHNFVDVPLRNAERPPRGLSWFTDSDWVIPVIFVAVVSLGIAILRIAPRAMRRYLRR